MNDFDDRLDKQIDKFGDTLNDLANNHNPKTLILQSGKIIYKDEYGDPEYLDFNNQDVLKKIVHCVNSHAALVEESKSVKAERDIWKDQLDYLKDKHLELHKNDSEMFSNDIICVHEVAIEKLAALAAMKGEK